MLILTARPGESVHATTPDGTHIEMVVIAVVGNQVRMGWNAPKSTTIDRSAVYERKQHQKELSKCPVCSEYAKKHRDGEPDPNCAKHGDVNGNRLDQPSDSPGAGKNQRFGQR